MLTLTLRQNRLGQFEKLPLGSKLEKKRKIQIYSVDSTQGQDYSSHRAVPVLRRFLNWMQADPLYIVRGVPADHHRTKYSEPPRFIYVATETLPQTSE